MQNALHDFFSNNITEDVLLPAAKSSLIKQTHDIISQAKKNASRIIKEAEAECEQIRRVSYRAGYEQGLVMSIDSVCQFIDNTEKYAHEMKSRIQDDLKNMLSDIISEDEFTLRVVEHWVAGLDKNDESLPLNILMPNDCRKLKNKFSQAIKSQYVGGVVFEFHNEPRFVFKYNNRLAEFYPDEFVYSTIDRLTSEYRFSEGQSEVSGEAIRYLHEQLSLLYPPLSEDHFEGAADE